MSGNESMEGLISEFVSVVKDCTERAKEMKPKRQRLAELRNRIADAMIAGGNERIDLPRRGLTLIAKCKQHKVQPKRDELARRLVRHYGGDRKQAKRLYEMLFAVAEIKDVNTLACRKFDPSKAAVKKRKVRPLDVFYLEEGVVGERTENDSE
jgi:hypothetical protein